MSDSYVDGGRSELSRRMRNTEEFDEYDVWSVLRDDEDEMGDKNERPAVVSRRLPTAARMIPKDNRERKLEPDEAKMGRQSAPVCIPEWSKTSPDDDDDENMQMTMPPHEWIALRQAKSNKTAYSVLEGAGRTLKGRDMRRVRHAVLARTGFLEF